MKNHVRLDEYAKNDIGLARGEVRLVSHHPRWKRAFSDEAHLIYDALRIEGLRLYHCGSTSIPSIVAKPILDIVGSVPSLTLLDQNKAALDDLGYEWKGEYGIAGRRYCVLYDETKTRAFIHLHLFQHGSAEVEEHILFRDFLRTSPDQAREYESVKRRLLKDGVPRADYSEAKSNSITALLSTAKKEERQPSRILALLGSAPGGAHTRSFLEKQYAGKEISVINLADTIIHPYRYDAHYPNDDVFSGIVEKMIASEFVVLASPVYWYAMSGTMKIFFDRFSNLLRGEHKALGEALYGKKVKLLATGSDERLPLGFEVPFSSTAIYLGMDYLGAEYKSEVT